MKKRVLAAVTMLFLLVSALPSFAAEVETEQRVFDYADLLEDGDEEEMQLWVEDMQENWGLDLAFLTTYDTEGKSVQQYGADFYVDHGLGLGETYDGVIFVLDMGTREGQIITCGKAIDIYTDYYIEEMWDNMVGYLSEGDYYWAFFTLYMDLNELAEGYAAYEADPDSYISAYQSHQKTKKVLSGLGIAAVFSLAIAGIAVAGMRKNSRTIRPYSDGRAYLKENGVTYTINRDTFASTHTAVMPIPQPKDDDHHGGFHSGGSWGGGSSTFRGGGGRSFGGGGGKF